MSLADWWVYIIETKNGKLYTGISTDVARRFKEHAQQRAKGAKFFRSDPPKTIVYREALESRSAATKREMAIKKLTRQAKLELIDSYLIAMPSKSIS